MNCIKKPIHQMTYKFAMIITLATILSLVNCSLVCATEIVHLSFDLGSGQKYESEILLPEENDQGRYQMVFQSLHSVTLFTELKSKENLRIPIIKLVTYGLTVQSKVVDSTQALYRFSLEYMGKPTLSLSEGEIDKIVIKDSPEDVKYEVNFALEPDTPVCSQMGKVLQHNSTFSSNFCITLTSQ